MDEHNEDLRHCCVPPPAWLSAAQQARWAAKLRAVGKALAALMDPAGPGYGEVTIAVVQHQPQAPVKHTTEQVTGD